MGADMLTRHYTRRSSNFTELTADLTDLLKKKRKATSSARVQWMVVLNLGWSGADLAPEA